ncbi:MAG: low-specificity L-threonine aldolase [Alphaproteobacteria bacterium]|nr:low-specificity L-threonine aldolase [Alphaproteobacteria bacterium]
MYAGMTKADNAASNRVVDLRSDTVTQPTPAMREAMARAEVGDDVFGEDPTIRALEEKVADLLGKEAGLYVTSGTQSNLLGVLSHCQRGEEYLIGDSYHVYRSEALGTSVLGGVASFPLKTDAGGGIDPGAVKAAIKPDDPHCPITKLLCLENTVSGRVQPQERIETLTATAHANGLSVHLDGARLMNAAVKQGTAPAALVASVDTVSLCLSKGLGAPVGSVLTGPKDFIARARRLRKMLGGGMRQAGVIAAAGLHALDHHVDRLAEDHANARRLAEGLAAFPRLAVDVDAVDTNMLFITPHPDDADPLRAHLAKHGVVIAGQRPKIRIVTHLDVTESDVDRVIAAVGAFYGGR